MAISYFHRTTKQKKMKEKVLLAIPSFQDPHMPNDEGKLGSLIKLLDEKSFNKVFLFGFQVWKLNAFMTEQYIKSKYSNVDVEKIILPVNNLVVYKDIFYNLKKALDERIDFLKSKNVEASFLLPPAFCDRVFDCWLLLATSLNIDAKIYQIEPHYSLEGFYPEDIYNKNLDWLDENKLELRDSITDNTIPIKEFVPVERIINTETIDKLLSGEQHSLLMDNNIGLSAWQMAMFIKDKGNKQNRCISIKCNELPSEICDDILFGYNKSININKAIQKTGIVERFNNAVIAFEDADLLPIHIQEKLANIMQNEQTLAGRRFIFSKNKTNNICNSLHEKLLNVN